MTFCTKTAKTFYKSCFKQFYIMFSVCTFFLISLRASGKQNMYVKTFTQICNLDWTLSEAVNHPFFQLKYKVFKRNACSNTKDHCDVSVFKHADFAA